MSSKASKPRKEAARQTEVRASLSAQPQSHWWWYAAGLAAALILVFQIYEPAIRSPFLFDDRYLPFLRPEFAQSTFRAWIAGVRPMLMASYWLNYQASSTEPFSYHVVNVFLHFANAVLVWLATRRILAWGGFDKPAVALLAPFGGLLFLLHPLQTESVTYIASRSESLSLLFFLGAFLVFLYRRSEAISIAETAAVLTLFGCAVTTKEHTAVLPALLLLTDFYWNPGFSLSGIRRNWKLYLPVALGAVAAGFFVSRVLATATSAGFGMKDLPWYQYFFTQCRAIWVYLRMFVLPYGLNVDHDFAISRNIIDGGAILGMLALIAVSAAAWFRRREYKLASYGWFAFLILLAPTSSVVPIQDVLVERRVYLAFLPLVLILCDLLYRVPLPRAALAPGLALLIAVFAGTTFARNQVWSNSIALWKDTAEKSPNKMRPHFQLAFAYYEQGRCAEAAAEYARTAQLGKPDYALMVDWGHALDCAGQPAAALEKFRAAAALENTAHAQSLIALALVKQGRNADALSALDAAEKLDRTFATTYIYRGNLLLLDREFDKAAAEFKKALSVAPNEPNALNGLDLATRRVVPNVVK